MGLEYLTCWHVIKQIFPLEVKWLQNQTMDPTDLNGAVKVVKKEEIDAFLSKIVHARTKTIFSGSKMQVMTQTLKGGEGSCLPHVLSIMNTYTMMTTGSK